MWGRKASAAVGDPDRRAVPHTLEIVPVLPSVKPVDLIALPL